MATADTTKRQGRPLAQSPVAEPKVKDVIQRLQEMEMRYLYQIQHIAKAFEQKIFPDLRVSETSSSRGMGRSFESRA